jgi:hypothetical protein
MPRTRDTVRSMTGSLLLILTGLLFLLEYAGSFRFAQTWPSLLIVLGVGRVADHLMGRAAAQKRETWLEC